MATDPEEPTETSMDHGVQKQSAPEEGSAFSNGAAAQLDEGDKKRKSLERPREPEEHSDKSYMTAISGPPPSGQIGGTGMSSQHTFGSSSYNIGQANGNGFLPGSMMMPPGSIAQNGEFSAAQFSAAQFSAAQNSMYSSPLATAGSGGHIIGEANLSAGMGMSMSMGSNAAVSHQLGISQMGSQGPYGTGAMSGSFGGSSGQLLGGYPGSSAKMAMPGEIMGTVTIPIYNTSPYPVPVTGSSQAGQQQYGNQARFNTGYMNPGAAVGETEWHRSDGGAHNTHYMREGSSANNHGSVNMTHTNRQPLSEENALAMQRQDECLLAAQMSYVDLAEDQQLAGDDVGRTDSVRGVRGAMAPKHASAATLVGAQQEAALPNGKRQKTSEPAQPAHEPTMKLSFGKAEHRGQRPYMQDRHCYFEHLKPDSSVDISDPGEHGQPVSLAAVFDGHKRCEPADMCCKRIHEILAREPAVFSDDTKPAAENKELLEVIERTFKQLDDEIAEAALASDIKECQFGGTTALMALISGRRLYVGHTGDSGAVMACTAGELDFPLRLTMDHKPNRPDEKERIERCGGVVDEKRNRVVSTPKKETNRVTMLNMSRALGDPQFKLGKERNPVDCTPEVRSVELNPGDNAIVLATDGLWDVLSDVAVVELLGQVHSQHQDGPQAKSSSAASDAAKVLMDEALSRKSADNITVLVICINWE